MLKGLRKGSHRRKNSSRNDGDLAQKSDPEFGMVPSLPNGTPSLGLSLAQLNRPKKVLSNNAAHALYGGRRRSDDDDDEEAGGAEEEGGYALELYSDCGESVSSLNDSCFGGASVTGGYNLPSSPAKAPSPLKQATSLVVGVVPPVSVSDFPSFDTEDVSVLVDLEQAVPSSAPSGTMIPITGSLNIKKKRKDRSSQQRDAVVSTAQMTSLLDLSKPTVAPIKILPPSESAEVEVSVTSNESFPGEEDDKQMTAPTLDPSRDTTTSRADPPSTKESRTRSSSCCPICLQRAPLWLKLLLLSGVILLLVAVILVVLGLILEFHSSETSNTVSAANGANNAPPTLAPTAMALPSDIFDKHGSPTPPPIVATASPTLSPTRKSRAKAEAVKAQAPTAAPVAVITAPPTPSVVLSYDPNTVLPAPSQVAR